MIKQKYSSKENKISYKWIPSKDYRRFRPITQVYGICFTKNGKVLIVKDLKNWKLPGGTPEKNENFEETLKREVLEEANVAIAKCFMIGAQEVIFPDNPNKEQGEKFLMELSLN